MSPSRDDALGLFPTWIWFHLCCQSQERTGSWRGTGLWTSEPTKQKLPGSSGPYSSTGKSSVPNSKGSLRARVKSDSAVGIRPESRFDSAGNVS